MGGLRTAFAALGMRNFRLLFGGSLLSTTAFMTTFLLVPVVAYEISGSYAATGIAQMGSGLSMFFLGPIGGVIADRYAKKPFVIWGQVLPALLILATGVLLATGLLTIPLLFGTTLLMGIGFALMGPAQQAWVGELIPRRLLANGVALQQMALNIGQVLGPSLGAVMLLVLGLSSGDLYFLVASFFLIVLPLTQMLPRTSPPAGSGPRRSIVGELRAGFSYLRSNSRLRSLWLYWMVIVVCGFAVQTLLPGILDREFGLPPNAAFVVYLIFGVAALAINVPLAGLVSGRYAWPVLLATGFLMALGYALLAVAPTLAIVLIMGAILGAGRSGVMLVNQSLVMTNSRPEYFGRVMSFIMLGFGAQSFLAPVWGGLADVIGGRSALLVVGLIAAIATALLLVVWLRLRHTPLEPGSAAAALQHPGTTSERPAAPELASPPLRRQAAPAFAAQVAPVALMEGQKPSEATDGLRRVAAGGG